MSISKSTIKLILFAFFSFNAISAKVPYSFFNIIGNIADKVISKGDLSEAHQKIFNEVAVKLNIQDREVKAKNSGLLLRLLAGYNNALAIEMLNRVYFNDSVLSQLSDGEKKFLMAHELTHHRQHHIWRINLIYYAINSIKYFAIKTALNKGLIKNDTYNVFKMYLAYGILSTQFFDLSIWGLIKAQISQAHETEADTKAITIAGADVDSGIGLINNFDRPETKNWPLYARITQKINSYALPILALPVLRYHVPHLASPKLRIAHLESLRNKSEITNSEANVSQQNAEEPIDADVE